MSVSTVASESAFSTGGRVLDPHQCSLSTRTVEALICTQNWLRSTPISFDEAIDEIEHIETGKIYILTLIVCIDCYLTLDCYSIF